MGARRGGREDSPLAGLLRRSPRQEEENPEPPVPAKEPDDVREPDVREPDVRQAPREIGVGEERRGAGPGSRPEVRRGAAGGAVRTAQKKRGRPRGGRRSNPDYVQISARIHKDVRFSLERVLAERSADEGRYVEMAEVIERLMRFYVEQGDPYDLLES